MDALDLRARLRRFGGSTLGTDMALPGACLWASARSPCGGGAGLGRDRPRADLDVRWRALGRARARLVVEGAVGQRHGSVE